MCVAYLCVREWKETLTSSHIKRVNLTELLSCGGRLSAPKTPEMLDKDVAGKKSVGEMHLVQERKRHTMVDKMHRDRRDMFQMLLG